MSIVTVKETSFLLSVERRIGGVDIEDGLLGRFAVGFHEHVHQQALDRCGVAADLLVAVGAVGGAFQPVQRALARQRLAAVALLLALVPFQVALAGQQRIAAQLVVTVEIFVAQRQRLDALSEQFADLMFDEVGVAAVFEAGGEARQQVDAAVDLAQQHGAAVGADHAAVKLGADLAPKMPGEREAGLGTLCNRTAACLPWR